MPQPFVPGPETERPFRDALGCFGSGVTVVTTMTPDGPVGMTANSFASVSIDPPLILWSVAKAPRRYGAFYAAERFAIHVLGDDQLEYAQHFAAFGDQFDRFDWAPNGDGVPILANHLALFDCRMSARHDAGDHTIIVGNVLVAACNPGSGLIFDQSQYGNFDPFETAKQQLTGD